MEQIVYALRITLALLYALHDTIWILLEASFLSVALVYVNFIPGYYLIIVVNLFLQQNHYAISQCMIIDAFATSKAIKRGRSYNFWLLSIVIIESLLTAHQIQNAYCSELST